MGYMTRKHDQLYEAVKEAERFIKFADIAMGDIQDNPGAFQSRAVAAAKRASMDLSNALVKVRGTYR